MKKVKNLMAIFLISLSILIGFSSFGSVFLLKILNLPVYFPEPFIACVVLSQILTIPSIERSMNVKRLLYILFILVVFLILIMVSVATHDVSLGSALSSGRGYLYLLLFAIFSPVILKNTNVKKLYAFSLVISLGEIMSVVYNLNYSFEYSGISAMNVYSICILSASSLFLGRRYVIFSLVICTIMIFTSGFRIIMLSSLVGYIVSSLYILRMSGAFSKIKILFYLIAFIIVVPIIFVEIGSYINDDFAYAVHRIIVRTSETFYYFLSGDFTGGRASEVASSQTLIDMMSIYPYGFIMIGKDLVGAFNDSPYLAIITVFGFPVGIMLMGYLVANIIMYNVYYVLLSRRYVAENAVLSSLSFVMLLSVFLNGRFLYITFESVIYGLALGVIIYKNNYRLVKGFNLYEHHKKRFS